MDAGLDRLDALVRDKLAGHPALRDLDEEAAAVHDPPELSGSKAPASGTPVGPGTPAESAGFISELTRQQLELSLRAALAKDAAFADRLAEAAATVRAADPTPPVQGGTSMKANASGYGRVYQAGRDQHINDR